MKDWLNERDPMTLVWILVLINLLVIAWWLAGASRPMAAIVLLLGITGILVVTILNRSGRADTTPQRVAQTVEKAMADFQPLAQDILENLVIDHTTPVIQNIKTDLHKNMDWLAENGHEFGERVLTALSEVKEMLFSTSGVILSDEMYQLQKRLEERVAAIGDFLDELGLIGEKGLEELEVFISRQVREIRESLQREQSISLRYLEDVIGTQLTEWAARNGEVAVPQTNRMAEQFTALMEKSLGPRMEWFKDGLLSAVEELSAKTIGKIQKAALAETGAITQLLNHVDRLMNQPRTPREKLASAQEVLNRLREELNDFMVTLAWQDLLVEKRWQEVTERLSVLQDEVLQAMEPDQLMATQSLVSEKIVQFSFPEVRQELEPVFQAVVAAEAVYLKYRDSDMVEAMKEGPKVILQYARVLEKAATESITLSDRMLSNRRLIRDEVRDGYYNRQFEQVVEQVVIRTPGLEKYLEGIYPGAFYSFCINPSVRYQPSSCYQAGWMLYCHLLDKGVDAKVNPEYYLLVGLLLVAHIIRNCYLQTSNSASIKLKNPEHIEDMRNCCLRALDIITRLEMPRDTRNEEMNR